MSENFVYELQLTSYNKEARLEVAKLIKNIFSITLAEVLDNLENLPFTLSQGPSLTKAKRISNELAKQNIVTEVRRVEYEAVSEND